MGGYPLMDRLHTLLQSIYIKPLAIQSNTARRDADVVAMAASMGLITTEITPHTFGRDWRVTSKGLVLLNEGNNAISHSVEGTGERASG
jgi:hypothetical protein